MFLPVSNTKAHFSTLETTLSLSRKRTHLDTSGVQPAKKGAGVENLSTVMVAVKQSNDLAVEALGPTLQP